MTPAKTTITIATTGLQLELVKCFMRDVIAPMGDTVYGKNSKLSAAFLEHERRHDALLARYNKSFYGIWTGTERHKLTSWASKVIRTEDFLTKSLDPHRIKPGNVLPPPQLPNHLTPKEFMEFIIRLRQIEDFLSYLGDYFREIKPNDEDLPFLAGASMSGVALVGLSMKTNKVDFQMNRMIQEKLVFNPFAFGSHYHKAIQDCLIPPPPKLKEISIEQLQKKSDNSATDANQITELPQA